MNRKGDKFTGLSALINGGRNYDELMNHVMQLFLSDTNSSHIKSYTSPDIYDKDRVTNIIPPITDVLDRENWGPSKLYIVLNGVVAIGRVFYTRTSGEYLIEELILHRGDVFGEFEVPLSLFEESDMWKAAFPPRFNMTYGAWASGPALNWAMTYPRHIPRESVAPDNAKAAVHPFYIKSKNIRPETFAEVIAVPIAHFEEIVRSNAEVMTWFLLNVLKKTRLYFEPPSPGYSRSAASIISRLFIRILAHRIRLGIVVKEKINGKTACRTFIGPTEWFKFGLSSFMADIKEIIQSTDGKPKCPHVLPIFSDELSEILTVTYHFPVKDLDDDMLIAMGCSPDEDRNENRYGLLTGIRIELKDIDRFMNYLLEKGE